MYVSNKVDALREMLYVIRTFNRLLQYMSGWNTKFGTKCYTRTRFVVFRYHLSIHWDTSEEKSHEEYSNMHDNRSSSSRLTNITRTLANKKCAMELLQSFVEKPNWRTEWTLDVHQDSRVNHMSWWVSFIVYEPVLLQLMSQRKKWTLMYSRRHQ